MTITCSIVDDEPLAISLLESYVSKTPFLELRATYSSAVEALEGLRRFPVDLLFLDIQMPELNGLEFSKIVPPETRIVFTTAYSQYALEGYKVNALDYLLKPISYTDFLESANRALTWFSHIERQVANDRLVTATTDSFFVKSEHKIIRIPFAEIIYIEGLKDYVKIHLRGRSKALLTLTSMKSLENYLSTGSFLRIHRSFIVNMQAVVQVERGQLVVEGGRPLPISDSFREQVMNYVNARMPGDRRMP